MLYFHSTMYYSIGRVHFGYVYGYNGCYIRPIAIKRLILRDLISKCYSSLSIPDLDQSRA